MMHRHCLPFSLLIAFYSIQAMASVTAKDTEPAKQETPSFLSATCQNFEGQAVRIQQGESPAKKSIASDQSKITLQINNASGKGSFKMWMNKNSAPIEGRIVMKAPPANKL